MKKSIVFLLFQMIAFACFSQTIHVKAIIIDSITRQPIEYATVRMLGASKGTMTNNNGYFNLKLLPSEMWSTLEISFIGYYTKLIPLSTRPLKNEQIVLLPRAYELKEITISDRRINWKDTVVEALKKRMQNYIATPYIATAFYRQTGFSHIDRSGPKKERIEAAFNLYVSETSKPFSQSIFNEKLGNGIEEDIQVTGIRGFYNDSLITDMSFFAYKNHLPFNYTSYTELFTQNINLYYKTNSFLKKYDIYTLEKTDTLNDLIIYNIRLEKEKSNERYCILKVIQSSHQIIEYDFFSKTTEYSKSLWSKYIEQRKVIYQLLENKIYPLQSVYHTDFRVYSKTNNELKSSEINNYTLLYTNIQPEGKLPFDNDKKISTGKDLVNQKIKYNEDFWKNYTILEE